MTITIDDIRAAADRIRGHARVTPLLRAPLLDRLAGRPVLVKAECLQITGSFKFRGAFNTIAALDPEVRARGVVALSSGNHAQGVAHAARLHGIPATIVMPSNAPRAKLDNTRAYGAEVVEYDRDTEDRNAIAERLAEERGLTLIRPYDEPMVMAGQGTCGLEIAAQAAEAGVTEADVLVCCGGGGLTSGIALALGAEAPGLRVRPVEPEGFDDVKRSLETGAIQSNDRMSGSICDAIVTPAPGQLTFPVMQRLCGPGLAVSDDDALRAVAAAFTHLRIVAEPGGAVALAAALFHPEMRGSDRPVIVTVSGGNVDAALFAEILERFA